MNVCRAYLALGSNLGDSKGYLQAAIQQLSTHENIEVVTCSSLYQTPPWGNTNQPDFFNCVIEIQTNLSAIALLDVCQTVEQILHRERKEKWGPRTIDVDIIWFDQRAICTPRLIIPHPYMYQRAFVLIPLVEIAPMFTHTLDRLPVEVCEEIQKIAWK